MRPKKDPGIRQEAFILAASELFMEKGFEGVSIRDVLDAVADKTASPSVFYYYFSSKDALYRACVDAVAQNYMSAMQEGFSAEGKSLEEWLSSLIVCMEAYLLNERNLMQTGSSTPNRLFLLDMRDRVTKEIGTYWAESLSVLFGVPSADAPALAQFLSGGIGEMMFSFMLAGKQDRAAVQKLAETAVRFCMNVIEVPQDKKSRMLEVLQELHAGGSSRQEKEESNYE